MKLKNPNFVIVLVSKNLKFNKNYNQYYKYYKKSETIMLFSFGELLTTTRCYHGVDKRTRSIEKIRMS